MAKFLSNINLETANDIQFKTTAGANAGKISQTGDDLVISNAVGDILLGNGSDDIYIGDGTNTVDIRFEQNMAIFADSGSTRTLTLGGANTSLVLESPTISGTLSLGATTISNKLTFTGSSGYILFDYEPTTNSGEYGTEVPLLKVDRSGSELTILSRMTNNGGLVLGIDDTTAIIAGDVKTNVKSGWNYAAETVILAAEGGFYAWGWPNNMQNGSSTNNGVDFSTYASRYEFRFRTDAYDDSSSNNSTIQSHSLANNGLYLGNGGSTQFIDMSRNLKNIGTVSSGAITSTGAIEGDTIKKTGGSSGEFLKADGTVDSNTYSTATGVANNADVTPSWVPAVDPSYLTSQTSHTDVVVDGDFASEGLIKRGSSAGSYSIVTDSSTNWDAAYTHSTGTHAPTNADNTAANETSHSDVLVDGDFGTAGFMKTDGAGTYSIDTSTYITSQRAISSTPADNASTTAISSDWAFDNVKTAVPSNAVFTDTVPTDFVSAANGGTFTGAVEVGLSTSTSGTTGTTFLELDNNVGGDISQQQTFIDFKFTDTNANYTPQVRIGAQVGPDADANAISKEGAGSFVVYTAPVGSDESGNSTGLAESFRVSHDKSATFAGAVTIAGDLNVNGTTTTIDTTNLNVEDNNITLNYSTGDSSASADGAGITIQDAVDASNNATMLWTASTDKFAFSHDIVANSVTLTGDQDISGIGTNSTNIATNVTNIATNATNIATNATAISNIPAESYTQHENISEATTGLNNSGRTYIQDITLDSNGHVTGVATATETVVNTNTNKFLSGISKPANSNTMTFTVTGGTNQSFTFGSNAFNSTSIPTGNAVIDWSTAGEEATIDSSYYTNTVYTHPTYSTTNTGALTGANVVSQISTNSTGHVTALATRTLTLSNLGFTGNSAADCVLNSTQTLGNKTLSSCTIDFDSNTISNIEVGNFKASSLVLEAEGIGSNDNDTSIPTSAAVKDYVDNAVIADTDTQDLSLSGDTISLDRGGSVDVSTATAVAANTAKTSFPGFGTSNTTALRGDTSIPSISGLATTTYVDTAETDAIAAAATAAAGLYVPNSGTTTIGGTKTFTGSIILNDSAGSSPTMRFMNTTTPTEDEVSIFCNTSGKMKFQQKLASVGSNVVQMTMDENGLDIENGLKVGTGATITTILDEDDMATDSATALATQQSIKAYVTSAVAGAGGGTMSSWNLDSDANSTETIEQGDTVSFDGGTGISTSRSGSTITITNDITNNNQLTNGANYTTNTGTTTASNTQTFTNKSGNISQWTNNSNYITDYTVSQGDVTTHQAALSITESQISDLQSYLTSVATANIGNNAVTMAKIKDLSTGRLIVGSINNGGTTELSVGTSGQVLTVQSNSTLAWETPSSGGSSYSLPTSSTSTLGGVKLGSDTQLTQTYNAGGAGSSNRVYPVQLNSSNQMGVNVPWSNSNTTYSAGDGIGLSGTTFSVSGGTGLTTDTNGLSLSTGDESNLGGFKIKHAYNSSVPTANNASTTAARTYGVTKNSSDQLVVNVPWTNDGGQPASTVTSVSTLSHANLLIGHDGTANTGVYLDFNSTTHMYVKKGNGNTALITVLASNGNTTFAGEITAGNFTGSSDKRIKKDIVDIPGHLALDTVMKTQGVRYYVKEENDEGVFPEKHKEKRKNGLKELGFIAQDLEEVLPELVVTAEDDFKSVDYMKMTVVLVEAMKEQQKQIDDLRKQVHQLRFK